MAGASCSSLDLPALAELGTCPGGTPVAGQINWCSGSSCANDLSGTIGDMPLMATGGVAMNGSESGYAGFDDGSFLRWARHPDTRALSWGLFIAGPQSPLAGQVFCLGSGLSSASGWIFTELSSLGSCPSTATGSLSGCVR